MQTCSYCGGAPPVKMNIAATGEPATCILCSAPLESPIPLAKLPHLQQESVSADAVAPHAASQTGDLGSESLPSHPLDGPKPNGYLDHKPHQRTEEERDEERRRALQDRGFILDEDAHGLRLSSLPSRRKSSSPSLSAYDIVRLAAELEGGVVPLEERIHCPVCDAVISPTDRICQWCSEPLK